MNINELKQAYLNTNYTINKNSIIKEELIININKVANLKNALPELKEWAFITAWNPKSNQLSKLENEQRNAYLLDDIRSKGYASHLGRGSSEDGNWSEDSFFIENISKEEALFYALKYEQCAFVYGMINQVSELIWTTKCI
ncbi:MAG: DUF3293 domain-containing protein [Saprospiraceae bacterium]|nr:DUF3293 domain-containing protein [Candidatus Defluviibacterium haderslevense]